MPKIGSTSRKRRGIPWRWIIPVLVPVVAIGIWALYLLGTENFHAIVPGEAYRAGQMDSNELARCIQQYGIRSIINLRGEHPEEPWYREELQAAQFRQVDHRSLALTSTKPVSENRWQEMVHLLRTVPKPVLIHCSGGADRTAFAAAAYKLEIANVPADQAAQEFSLWYGYWPLVWKKKAALRDSFFANVVRSTHYGRIDQDDRGNLP